MLTSAEFAGLFQRASRRLWCVAVGIVGNGAQAEDIVQEAASIALEKLTQFDPHSSFDAWMAQIVRFVAMNERRRGARQRTTPMDPAAMSTRPAEPSTPSPAGRSTHQAAASVPIDRHGRLRPDQDAFDDALSTALGELGEMARSCLLLRTVLDLSYTQIAELLAIPEGTAMSHVHRSRHALRDRLGGTHPKGAAR